MSRLYLCEKPSQAKDIAKVLGVTHRKNGYFEGNDIWVTWCFGHLLEMAAPEDYDPALKQWRLDTLPIVPGTWQWKVRKEAKKQYALICSLFKQANHVVIATDADREGEAIAREVMEKGGWRGKISRLWLSALDETSIKKALDTCLPGEQTENLYHAAMTRAKADWLVGMTLSRLYTLIAKSAGMDAVLSVGRVQTPTLNLVVERDRVIERFRSVPFFEVKANVIKDDQRVGLTWVPAEPLCDDQGHCLNQSDAQGVVDKCIHQPAKVKTAETKRIKQPAPLPFSLSALQQEASKQFGMGAQAVLDLAQALYETHKATTYPRTDCSYLPESQFEESSKIIHSLGQISVFNEWARQAQTSIQSACWNDQKITAHHAMIPTTEPMTAEKWAAMNPTEQQIYRLICQRYLAQFYPHHEYDQTKIEWLVSNERFVTQGRVNRVTGWTQVMGVPQEKKEESVLPVLSQGDEFTIAQADVIEKKTTPPKRFTEGTLIQAMQTIGKYVENPALKKLLKETSGIGTEATRASIIETLLKRGFIVKQGKKQLISSDTARTLIDAVPEPVKNPMMTAVWEQALEEIAQGHRDAEAFIQDQIKTITRLTEQVKQQRPEVFDQVESHSFLCPDCNQALIRRKSKTGKGYFWGCSGYPECKLSLPDSQGKPGKPQASAKVTGKGCPECTDGQLMERTIKRGKKKGQTFLGCSNYPDCQFTSQEKKAHALGDVKR